MKVICRSRNASRNIHQLLGPAALIFILAGCGGGSGNAIATGPTETDFGFGSLVGRAAISNPPVTSAGLHSAATAFSGTFSSLKLRELNPSLDDSRIFFASTLNSENFQIYSSAPDGSDLQQLTNLLKGNSIDPCPAATGKVAFGQNVGGEKVFIMNADGSNIVQLTTTGNLLNIAIDAAGDKIVGTSGAAPQLLTVATKVLTPLPTPGGGFSTHCVISADGKTVYFDYVVSGDTKLFEEPSDGTGAPQLMTDLGAAITVGALAVSPDDTEVGVLEPTPVAGSSATFVRVGTGNGHPVITANDLPPGDTLRLTYSPDGTKIVFELLRNGGLPNEVDVYTISTGLSQDISNPIAKATSPGWSPFVKDHVLIDTGGGILGTRACGVISTQRGTRTASVVAFDVTTPSSVVITAQTATNNINPNLVFSADADSITKMAFANATSWRGFRIVGSGTPVLTANGALISIEELTGRLVSILPFTGSRSLGSRPTIHDSGSIRTFTGHFLGVFDEQGKNLAPSGASSVQLDMRTNSLKVN